MSYWSRILRQFAPFHLSKSPGTPLLVSSRLQWRVQCARTFQRHQKRFQTNPADDPAFTSIVDNPPQLVKAGKKHGPGLIILALIPLTAFCLGTWQVQRLSWKTDLIARYEDRLLRDPLPLPPFIDPSAIAEFDFRRVEATGRFRHNQEMLIGPRLHDGENGYLVVTPLERKGGSTILVCRGWISKALREQSARVKAGGDEALPQEEIVVQGLLREPWKKNRFTPANKPEEGAWYFPDVQEMSTHVGAQPVWVEETMQMELLEAYRREARGVPIGRPPEVNLRNNHAQYIFTWYTLCAATTFMLYMLVKKKPTGIQQRVRRSREW